MKLRVIEAGVDQWIAARVTPARTAGLHVSVILTDMLKSLPGKKYETWGRKRADDERDPMWEAGYLWEDVLAKALADRPVPGGHLVAPFELELDGIYGTPDRLLVETGRDGTDPPRIVDEEVKFTWMSCKELLVDPAKRPETVADWRPAGLTADVKFTYWLLQAKTYAAMLWLGRWHPSIDRILAPQSRIGERIGMIHKAADDIPALLPPLIRLRALFINGAYRGDLAIPGAWEIEYTAEDLETWWRMFRDHAHRLTSLTCEDRP